MSMRLAATARLALALVAAGTFAACGDTTTAPVTGPLPLGTGYWYMHFADDSALSTTIASRSVGVVVERTQLDSAVLRVLPDGSYEQRWWMQTFLNGAPDRTETVVDYGSWRLSGDAYAFTSEIREREFLVAPTINGRLQTLETMVFFQDPPETEGIYRRTPP